MSRLRTVAYEAVSAAQLRTDRTNTILLVAIAPYTLIPHSESERHDHHQLPSKGKVSSGSKFPTPCRQSSKSKPLHCPPLTNDVDVMSKALSLSLSLHMCTIYIYIYIYIY